MRLAAVSAFETSPISDVPIPPEAVSRPRVRFFAACAAVDRESIASVMATLQLSSTPVFLDRDYAKKRPGKVAATILGAIAATPQFILFWSSETVADGPTQWQLAIAQSAGRTILPVKLDATPLPPELANGPSLDFTELAVESLEEQDDLLGEYALSDETREFWYRIREKESTLGPAQKFFEVWVYVAFALSGAFLAIGAGRNPSSSAWLSIAVGLSVGIVFGPLLAHAFARVRARREMDRWLASTFRLYLDPTAARLRAADGFKGLSPLEAAALLHERLRV